MSTQVEVVGIDLEDCRPEFQRSDSTSVGTISSYPLSALRRTAIVTSMVAIGTIPVPAIDHDLLSNGIEAHFVLPSSSEATLDDQYSRIREEIVASGIPM